ncbi:MAG: Uma2 family endonuclease [Nevskiaceae bacterium]|jgi:Uma2 family endonuclease|nr:Uma2 family endonuclease [Nevskiaceae bacterium]
MSAVPKTRPATYDDLFDLPENQVGEIIEGTLHAHPRPASEHALVSSSLGIDLGGPFQKGRGGPGGWWIVDEPELHLDANIFVPDLAGWRRERMPVYPKVKWFELVPDWVCEILSPGTARLDRQRKMPLYAAAGVPHLWLIDPDLRLLEAYENRQGQWTLIATHADDEVVRVPPFDAVALELSGLWA